MAKPKQLVLFPDCDFKPPIMIQGVIWPNVNYRRDKARFRWLQRLWIGGSDEKA